MAPKKGPTQEQDTIEISRIEAETLSVPILGTSPIIVHRFSEKAKRQMLDAMQGRKSPKEPKDPEGEYVAAFYRSAGVSYLQKRAVEKGFSSQASNVVISAVASVRDVGCDRQLVGMLDTAVWISGRAERNAEGGSTWPTTGMSGAAPAGQVSTESHLSTAPTSSACIETAAGCSPTNPATSSTTKSTIGSPAASSPGSNPGPVGAAGTVPAWKPDGELASPRRTSRAANPLAGGSTIAVERERGESYGLTVACDRSSGMEGPAAAPPATTDQDVTGPEVTSPSQVV